MKGLLMKDLLLIKKSFSLVYLMPIALSLFVGIGSPSSIPVFLGVTIAIVFSFQAVTTMEFDSNTGWERSVAAMPITVTTEVVEKYALSLLMLVCSAIVTLVLETVLVFSGVLQSSVLSISVILAIASSTLYVSVIIPAIYKFGIAKSRMVFIAFITIITVIPMLASLAGVDIYVLVAQTDVGLGTLVVFLFLLLTIACSTLLSIRIKRNVRISPTV
jgi:ABC-2 type transport system permease protein